MGTTLGVKVDDALRARLRRLAEQRDRTPHWIVKAALAEYLDREERYQRELEEDTARWEDFALTGRSLSQTEVRAHFAAKLRKKGRLERPLAPPRARGSRSPARLPARKRR